MKLERSKNYRADSIQRKIDKVKYEQEKINKDSLDKILFLINRSLM
ncbi:hypothetical protein [Oceanirhabdus seepicola]|uniref:Uncharacterized protein n=1 Tax=Oceanirhabdus seepicola TaxID=2828781 RepID=A0A9J6NWC6_9CLOT|nr:hypothetical protein [Oceanirhabdus seepicola]MCM1988364.1 hypothetical protein [Oceanirhabdus seepicola]